QRVEILKTLYRGAEIVILDEPTAVLTPQEIDELIDIMKALVEEGKSIILITHKLKEIMRACDRCTVIRKGKGIGTVEVQKRIQPNLPLLWLDEILALNLKKNLPIRKILFLKLKIWLLKILGKWKL